MRAQVATETPIPLTEPSIDAAEHQRVAEALSGRLAGNGPFGRRVESRLSTLLAGPPVLLTTSCTHALELALLALGIGRGDEVVVPSFTFVSTANAVLRVGARPVFADIADDTLGLDPVDVEKRLTSRTRALVPVHYAGIAADMDGLLAVAGARGLKVIEDAAHGLGGAYRGKPLGTIGDAGCFSFHETKNITCGEGGAVALRDPEAAARAEIVREKGTNRSAFLRGEVDKYTWVAEGSSYVLSDILAALLDAQLDKLTAIQARRRAVAARYRDALAGWAARAGARLTPELPDRDSSDHLFYVLLPDERRRDETLARLRGRGILAAFHYVPLHDSPFWSAQDTVPDLPVTDRVARTLLRLPLHARLADRDVDRVIGALEGSPV